MQSLSQLKRMKIDSARSRQKNLSPFNNPHPIMCKAPKHAMLRSITHVTRSFSTLFFTELLKTRKKKWK
jgi:hypothetical protein